ncbi:MAG: bifunctional metallophosphatase/5'-nucleotidase [Desulfococcaceae bacterium]
MADFPILSANTDATADPYLNGRAIPYEVREIDGTKIGIVGLTLPDTAVISSPGEDVVFEDAAATARDMVEILEADGINKIIFLTHLGYERDLDLAQSVEGIDLIVGGHSHSLLGDFTDLGLSPDGDYPTHTFGPTGEDVYIVHSWEWAKTLGVVDVQFNEAGIITEATGNAVLLVGDEFEQKNAAGDKVVVDADTKAAILAAIEADPNIEVVAEDAAALAMLEPYKDGVDEVNNEVIGTAAEDLLHIREPGVHTSGAPLPNGSRIAPIVAEAMVWKANSVGLDVDLSLQNAGGVRIDVPAGPITVGTAYTLLPFGNTLYVLDLTGAELMTALETGLTRKSGAFPYVGSARYTADPTRPEGERLVSLEIRNDAGEWVPVNPDWVYRVATNAYLAGGGDGYSVLENADGYRYDTGFVDAETFMDYVRHVGTLNAPEDTGVTYSPAEAVTLKIIETTDVHGSLFPYDFIEAQEIENSLAQVYTYVKQERSQADQSVILLDNGDILQGQPITNYYNYERSTLDDHIVADVMNYMGYDAASVGNHDIEPGRPVYDAVMEQFEFPWLAANAVYRSTGEPYFEPYTVIERDGVKAAVLGLITPGIPNWLPESVWPHLEFKDMIETARDWVPIIQAEENPDLLIGLFHSGFDYTYGGTDENTPENENASQLVAREIPGFDIIFIGHDHMDRNETVTNTETGRPVLILGAKSAARSVAVATVTLTPNGDGTHTKVIVGDTVDATRFAADPQLTAAFTPQIDAVKDYVDEEIGTFTEATSSRDAMFGDSSFNDLIHELQFEVTEEVFGERADVSFAAPLQFDKTIEAGPVYIRDMYKLYKYENQLYLMELTGAEIDGHLEFSYARWTNRMTGPEDHLLNFTDLDEATGNYDLAARYYNYDSAAGIVYTVDVSRPEFDRVTILGMDADLDGQVDEGAVFDPNAVYLAAVNSYRGGGGGGHLTDENGAAIPKEALDDRKIDFTDRDLRFYLIEQIREAGTVTPRTIGNWKFIPEDWAAQGAERDRPILFGSDSGAH